jgi:hypothetical protein
LILNSVTFIAIWVEQAIIIVPAPTAFAQSATSNSSRSIATAWLHRFLFRGAQTYRRNRKRKNLKLYVHGATVRRIRPTE